ncbi:hypothetical protein GWO43_30525 [candidate division KSB1 bacterium]|nr:hypothetical protein [candidate division KSB1 bacterium]NIR72930.1 hypothetical protein [candidate division KSB1 bacterium]NIS28229.1 hypothetical protein [candidate division KSB1 bacterium]NIT75118.1 hypothetical protein [candidate division KSB1 bacterium]NIU28906.1 hypothetical protein [candidate division KSB1 bacterium]
MNAVYLKSNKLKPIKHRHPWLFSGAIEKVDGQPEPGEVLEIKDATGEFLAWGYYNPHSQIALRLLEWEQSHEISEDWWQQKLEEAIGRRGNLLNRHDSNAVRLVNAESDMLPGLIVDKYAEFIVLQSMPAGIERVKQLIVEN